LTIEYAVYLSTFLISYSQELLTDMNLLTANLSNRTLLCRNEFETRIMKFRLKRLMAGLKPDILIYHLNP